VKNQLIGLYGMVSRFIDHLSLKRYTFLATGTVFLIFTLIVCESARRAAEQRFYDNFAENASLVTSTIAASANDDISSESTSALNDIVARIVDTVPDIKSIIIYNEHKEILSAWGLDVFEKANQIDTVAGFERSVISKGNINGHIALAFDLSQQQATLRASAFKIYTSGIAIISACALLILGLLNHIVVNPIQRIHQHLLAVQAGEKPEPLKLASNTELYHLGNTVNEFGNSLELSKQKERELKEISNAKTDFLANMSHELRTPMNGVLGMLALLEETPLNPEQNEQVRIATSSSKSLLTLINDILDFSKLEAGKLKYEKIDFQLEALVDECTQALSESAHSKNIDFVCNIDPNIPVNAIGDPTRLRQVITNVTSNAIKFTDNGCVTIHVSHSNEAQNPDWVKFSITDTGVGISKNVLQKLFKSFAQADSSTTRKFGGTGLGLAISRRLVDGMGGQIGVKSEVNKGSVFWFTLPLPAANGITVREANQVVATLPSITSSLAATDNTSLKILLLEHIQTSQENIAQLLGEHSPDVHTANCGDEALSLITEAIKAQDPFDVVFFSTHILDMSAREFIAGIEQLPVIDQQPDLEKDPSTYRVKLIALNTISQTSKNIYTHTNEQIAAQLSKPVKRSEISKALLNALVPSSEGGDHALTSSTASPKTHTSNAPSRVETASDSALQFEEITILVAEDNLINQQVAMGMLENLGFSCVLADNGQLALDLLNEYDFDLILMDCQMPVLDGFATTQKIRLCESESRIPILALTANAMQGDAEKCLAAGMDGFLTKPIERDKFEQAIFGLLKDRIDVLKHNPPDLGLAA